MTRTETQVCSRCYRPVVCEYDGDNFVGQCTWCGKFTAYQYCPKEDEPAEPEKKPELLGVQVDYWEDEGRPRTETFSDPDEGCDFAD